MVSSMNPSVYSRPENGIELRAKNLSKTFGRRNSEFLAIKDITLDIEHGEFCAIVGPSGCGKTTFLNIVAGFERPTSGMLTYKGEKIQGPGPERGVVFQDYALFPWKRVRENVEFGLRSRGLSARECAAAANMWIKAVGLEGSEHKYPHELSGGMRQRCALARALANDPEMLLMDEPLAAVDAQTRRILQDELLSLWGEMKEQQQRKTVLYVTHSIEEAIYLSDKIVVMSIKPGRISHIISNDLPRPRQGIQSTAEYGQRCAELWELLETSAKEALQAEGD